MGASFIVKAKGNWEKTFKLFENAINTNPYVVLNRYGKKGVNALAAATPIDTGKTASSWDYHIEKTNTGFKLVFTNSNVQDDVSIAIVLQYGHLTKQGTYVKGRDYINPALVPIFDGFANDIWAEVQR